MPRPRPRPTPTLTPMRPPTPIRNPDPMSSPRPVSLVGAQYIAPHFPRLNLQLRTAAVPRVLAPKSFGIRTSKDHLPQAFHNQHFRARPTSAENKGLINPAQSALTNFGPVTPVESALPKNASGTSMRATSHESPNRQARVTNSCRSTFNCRRSTLQVQSPHVQGNP
jgi:hypothetical protein